MSVSGKGSGLCIMMDCVGVCGLHMPSHTLEADFMSYSKTNVCRCVEVEGQNYSRFRYTGCHLMIL